MNGLRSCGENTSSKAEAGCDEGTSLFIIKPLFYISVRFVQFYDPPLSGGRRGLALSLPSAFHFQPDSVLCLIMYLQPGLPPIKRIGQVREPFGQGILRHFVPQNDKNYLTKIILRTALNLPAVIL